MKGIRIIGERQVEICELPDPEVGAGEALLKMRVGGICGSDLSTYRGKQAYASFPVIPGHELAAEIAEIGENDKGLKPGMLVTVNPYFNCGKCYSCRRGLVNCCENNQTMGVQRNGAFTEYFSISTERIYDGKGLSPERIALIEPFCIGYHGIKRASVGAGEKVFIVGAGTIGVFAAISAAQKGAEVYMCDVSAEKLQYARENFPVAGTILNDNPDAIQDAVRTITGGDGFDVTVEAVGLASTFMNCIDAAAFGGRVVQIGVGGQHVDFPFLMLQKKELAVFGSRNALKEDFTELIDIIDKGAVNIDKVITNQYEYTEAAEAFANFDRDPGTLKTILRFS